MARNLFSPSWYRVADLRPALGSHTALHRHVYRGEVCYVLRDHASSRLHRFSPAAYHLIGLMDGQRKVQEIAAMADLALGDAAPTQEEIIELLAQLHAADVLKVDGSPDTQELFRRYQAREQQQRRRRFWSPLAQRFALLDPDAWLQRALPAVAWLFGPIGIVLWLAAVGPAAVLAALHWPELTENVADRILNPQGLLVIGLSYPVIKVLHELGHAFAVKRWGGDVHEIGIMLLVLMPVPYVDASAASAFADKRRRMVVGAAGILVEMLVAALALFVWLAVQPGLLKSLAFNVMFIGGVSTVLFNGNPLLRYDGYYVLADALELPNLAGRSQKYLAWLCQRYLLGLTDSPSPVRDAREASWLVSYGVASFIYRVVITCAIILFIAGKFLVIGVILAGWAAGTQLLLPMIRNLGFLLANPRLEDRRARVLGATAVVTAMTAALLFLMPFPLWTTAEGVVWAPQQSEIRAATDGFVVRVLATPNSRVRPGDALLQMADPTLPVRVSTLEADLQETTARYNAVRMSKQVEADNLREKIATIEADLARARERVASLTLCSAVSGVFLLDAPTDLVGRYLHQGDLVAFVADRVHGTVRVAVTQADIGIIRRQTRSVAVRLADRVDLVVPAVVRRSVPSATEHLPSAVLGSRGGGLFAVDPGDTQATRTLQKIFDIELELAQPADRLGGRAYVRFDLGAEPLGRQWYRRFRQLFLRQFDV